MWPPFWFESLVEAKRHLWRSDTAPNTISESDKLLKNVVVEYEKLLTPEQRAMVAKAI